MSQIRHNVVFAFVSGVGLPGIVSWGARTLPSEVEQKHKKNFWADDEYFSREALSSLRTDEAKVSEDPEAKLDPQSYISDLQSSSPTTRHQKGIYKRRRRWRIYFGVMKAIGSSLMWVFALDVVAGGVSGSYYAGYTHSPSLGALTFDLWLGIGIFGMFLGGVYLAIGQRFERLAFKIEEGQGK